MTDERTRCWNAPGLCSVHVPCLICRNIWIDIYIYMSLFLLRTMYSCNIIELFIYLEHNRPPFWGLTFDLMCWIFQYMGCWVSIDMHWDWFIICELDATSKVYVGKSYHCLEIDGVKFIHIQFVAVTVRGIWGEWRQTCHCLAFSSQIDNLLFGSWFWNVSHTSRSASRFFTSKCSRNG